MHTIIPGMLVEDGKALAPFGVMGGHYQATGHAQVVHLMLDRGLDSAGGRGGAPQLCP